MRSYLLAADSADPMEMALFKLSGRIAALLESPRAKASQSLQASLDDMLGAVYSLIFATHYGYADRPEGSPIEIQVVVTRAKDMAGGKVRSDGKWTAGFYFNNALFRISAVYHRILKIVTGHEGERLDAGKLRPDAEAIYLRATNRTWENQDVRAIHTETNTLKHTADGVYEGRHATFQQAIQALDQLLELLEVWTYHRN